MSVNPIIELAEMVQEDFGRSIQTRLVDKSGPDHMPVITVEIELPDGRTFEASGSNQKLAKQKAAELALEEY